MCSFAVFSRVVNETRVRESWNRARVERSRKRIENRGEKRKTKIKLDSRLVC